MIMNTSYYRHLLDRLYKSDCGDMLDTLAGRLADAEEARQIMSAKGYEGHDLASQCKTAPPAKLKYS